MNRKKNDFSALLSALIHNSEVKNSYISSHVGYDISYISKWTSGKNLPSGKNINKLCSKIASCIVSGASAENIAGLYARYGGSDTEELSANIEGLLINAYAASKSDSKKSTGNTPEYYGTMSVADVLSLPFIGDDDCGDNCTVIIDPYSMDQSSRLQFAGITNGRFTKLLKNADKKFLVALYLDENNITFENILYLIHLISKYCGYDLEIYNDPIAYQKIVYAVESKICVTGFILPGTIGDVCSSVSVVQNSNTARQLYDMYRDRLNEKNLVFTKYTLDDFVNINGIKMYMKSLMSENISWLFGHVTELILPDSVFDRMLCKVDENLRPEYKKLHEFSEKILRSISTNVMIYDTAISDMMSDGVIDFFGHRLDIDVEGMKEIMAYLHELVDSSASLRLIEGGFENDYKHVFSPCIFISDSISYLRIENDVAREKIYVLNSGFTSDILSHFFKGAWNNGTDALISDRAEIGRRLSHFENLMDYLPNGKTN